jgi:hypothetical protein
MEPFPSEEIPARHNRLASGVTIACFRGWD